MMIRWDMIPTDQKVIVDGEQRSAPFMEPLDSEQVWGSTFWGRAGQEDVRSLENRNAGAFQAEVARGAQSDPPAPGKPLHDPNPRKKD